MSLEIREPGVKMLTAVTKVVESGEGRKSASKGTRRQCRSRNRWPRLLPKSQIVVTENLVERLRI